MALLCAGCTEELAKENVTPLQNSLTVQQAKEWYNTKFGANLRVQRVNGSDSTVFALKPLLNWDMAELENDSLWSVVELPWEYANGGISMAATEVKQYAEMNHAQPQQILRLVIMKNRKTGDTYGFKMAVLPDLDYMLQMGKDIENNTYLKRSNNLSGAVLFYTINNTFVNGWRYKEGKIIAKLNKLSGDNPRKDTPSGLQKSYRWVYYRVETCYYFYAVANGEAGPIKSNGCKTEIFSELINEIGPEYITDGSYNYNYNDADGGGGGGNTSSTEKKLSDIFKLKNLSEEKTNYLDEKYKETLKECIYNSIDDALRRSGITFGYVSEKTGMYGSGSISNTGDFTVEDVFTTDVEVFRHEWVHLYQRYKNNLTTFGDKVGMMEFERAVFRDIDTYHKGSDLNKKLFDDNYYSWIQILEQKGVENNSKKTQEYINWIRDLATGSIDLTAISSIDAFRQWADLYGQHSNTYGTDRGYKYNGVHYSLNALSGLIQILNNCK